MAPQKIASGRGRDAGAERGDDRAYARDGLRAGEPQHVAHRDIDASDVELVVTAGRATFTGTVPDRRTKRRVEDVAESIFGVLDIDNQLRVRSQPPRGEDPLRDEH